MSLFTFSWISNDFQKQSHINRKCKIKYILMNRTAQNSLCWSTIHFSVFKLNLVHNCEQLDFHNQNVIITQSNALKKIIYPIDDTITTIISSNIKIESDWPVGPVACCRLPFRYLYLFHYYLWCQTWDFTHMPRDIVFRWGSFEKSSVSTAFIMHNRPYILSYYSGFVTKIIHQKFNI